MELFEALDSRQQQSSVLGAWRVWLGAADEMHETDSSALLSCTHKSRHATQLITTEPVNIASKWVNIVSRRVINMEEYCEQKNSWRLKKYCCLGVHCAAMTANLTRRIRSTPTNVSN